jgi:hypothetical protein
VRRDPDGSHHLENYEVTAAEEKAVLKLDIALLRHLPLDQTRRVVFGARLANVARGRGGVWEVEFERDSGVLLTDEGAAAALGPVDAALREVLREQTKWTRTLP